MSKSSIHQLPRVFGLDLLRSVAIILVTIVHSATLITDYFSEFPFITLPDGVDLFFVLSGFLIGSILIQTIHQYHVLHWEVLIQFLKRRWLRTLPNYFLFLGINVLLISFGLINGGINKYLITYFVFFQNFYVPFDFLFWESWSLSVEEWFYVLFPLLVFFVFRFKPSKFGNKTILISTILCFLIVPFLIRWMMSYEIQSEAQRELYIRKLVITRLDCIAFGLFGAFIKKYYSEVWNKTRSTFFIAGLVLMILLCNNFFGFSQLFLNVFYFSLIGVSALFLLPLLDNLNSTNELLKPIEILSKISYSMYLIQIPLFQLFIRFIPVNSCGSSIVRYSIYWLCLILLSAINYRYFEKYFLKLRD